LLDAAGASLDNRAMQRTTYLSLGLLLVAGIAPAPAADPQHNFGRWSL
jgi:hypothetical protein